MFEKKTIRDIEVEGKIVLVRADYNVPLDSKGDDDQRMISSDFRIRAELPTLRYLLEHGARRVIIISHLGRPDGRDEKLSLSLVAERLAELLPGVPVDFIDETTGAEVAATVDDLAQGGILLLENLRFAAGEKTNSTDFAREIVESTGAEIFVQDGFAVTHRAHASTDAITKLLPAVAGLLLEKEVTTLTKLMQNPDRPLAVMIGGAKVADKQPLIERFSSVADRILVGGKIAADGYATDDPKVYVAEDFDEDQAGVKLDIGPFATAKFVDAAKISRTVLWNGVLGRVEDPAYATASTLLAETLGENSKIESIICGGDTAGFVENLQAERPDLHFSLISTGGGAALALLSGEKLPGLENLLGHS